MYTHSTIAQVLQLFGRNVSILGQSFKKDFYLYLEGITSRHTKMNPKINELELSQL